MNNTLISTIVLIACLLTAAGCGKKPVAADASDSADPVMTELPLPAVPGSLQSVEARAAYVVAHFWDAMDFGSPQACDTAFVEQSFANYISLLPLAPPDSAQAAVDALMRRAAAYPAALELLMTTADDYLYHPNSPMRNEEVYILFLKALTCGDYLSAEQRIIPEARLADAMKNRPGSVAADFRADLRGGGRSTLGRIAANAEMTLLIFYDPDCHNCHVILNELAEIPLPQGWQIAAVDSEPDRSRWEATCGDLPAHWTVMFPASADLSELYTLPASPTFYVLDRGARVVLKDPSPETVGAMLQQR